MTMNGWKWLLQSGFNQENGISAERGIIFCFSHRDCCEVYEYFERELGQHMFDLGKNERIVEI